MSLKLSKILMGEIDPAFAKRAFFILQAMKYYKPKKILDVGCGRGFYLKALSLFKFPKEIHGIDINKDYLKVAKNICNDNRVFIQQANIYSLPFPNNYFDFIIASEILEHLKNDIAALLEIKRVLKPKGLVVITVPNYNFPFLWDPINWILMKFFNTHINKDIWWLAGIWADHQRLYTVEKISKLVLSVNFKIKKIEYAVRHCWPFSHFLLYGLGKNLIEKFNLYNLSRFNFNKKSISAQVISQFFKIPSILLDNLVPTKSSVNILVLLSS